MTTNGTGLPKYLDLDGPDGVEAGVLSVENAWHKLMTHFAKTVPGLVQKGHSHLDAIDRITKLKSTAHPPGF
jgi:hypothetical protein